MPPEMGSVGPPGSPHSTVSGEGSAAPQAEGVAQNDASRAEANLPPAGVFEALSSALAWARTALSSFLDLVSLEAQRAGLALMWMVAVGVVAAVCIIAAWLGLMAALAMGAIALGCPPIAAVIVVASVNLLAGAVLIHVCIGMSRDLLFSATRRQLAGKPLVAPEAS